MSKRALITGVTGFTGRYMQKELEAAGYEVHGLVSGEPTLPRHHQVDICDLARLKQLVELVRPHVVIHLAAIAFVGHGSADDFYRVNVVGTRNLLAALSDFSDGIECVLLASSANVYGNRTAGVLTEDVLPDPANDYAVSKLAMEYMAKLWMHRLPIVIARPFNYTGPGQSEQFLLPKIVGHFRRSAKRIELGNLDVWRDFSDVRVVVAAYRALIEAADQSVGETFNVCSGKAVSLREVIAMMESLAGYSIDISVNPAFVRASEVRTLTGSHAKLSRVSANWSPIALRDTFEWMYRAADQ